jgi:predicted nucleic acid-binding protein
MAQTGLMVVDTTVLIDALRGHRGAREYLLGEERRLYASEVTRIEILRGVRPRERPAVEATFRAIRWIPVDERIARRAGTLARQWDQSHRLGLADSVIAATAQELGAGLATSNVRHFPMFPGLTAPY